MIEPATPDGLGVFRGTDTSANARSGWANLLGIGKDRLRISAGGGHGGLNTTSPVLANSADGFTALKKCAAVNQKCCVSEGASRSQAD